MMAAFPVLVYVVIVLMFFTPLSVCVSTESDDDDTDNEVYTIQKISGGKNVDESEVSVKGSGMKVANVKVKDLGHGKAEDIKLDELDNTLKKGEDSRTSNDLDTNVDDAKLDDFKVDQSDDVQAQDIGPDPTSASIVLPLSGGDGGDDPLENIASEVSLAQQQSVEDAKEAARVASFLRGAGRTASNLKKMAQLADEATQVTRNACQEKLVDAKEAFLRKTDKLRKTLKTCNKDVKTCQQDSQSYGEVLDKLKKQVGAETDKRLAAEEQVEKLKKKAKKAEKKLEAARKQMQERGYTI